MNLKLAQKDHKLRRYGLNYELNLLRTLENQVFRRAQIIGGELKSLSFSVVQTEKPKVFKTNKMRFSRSQQFSEGM